MCSAPLMYRDLEHLFSESRSHSADVGSFLPVALLDAHTSRISTLASCVFEWTPAIASSSSDGTMCLWDPDDGRCLLRQAEALPGEASDEPESSTETYPEPPTEFTCADHWRHP